MQNRKPVNTFKNVILLIMLTGLFTAGMTLLPGCGSGGTPSVTQSTSVAGMVIVPTTSANLARLGIPAAGRQAAQTASCGAVPAGYTAVPGAAISVSGFSTTATTDSSGCFSMDLTSEITAAGAGSPGILIFTATKSNAGGGVTKLKKAANITAGSTVTLINDDAISAANTLAALIVEKKIEDGETDVDPDDIEEYLESIEDQDDIQALYAAILAAGDAGAAGLDAISDTLVDDAELTTDKPAIWSAAITGSPVAATGGQAGISAKATAFGDGNTLSSVSATLTPTAGGSPISVTMAADATTANLYSGSYTFPANSLTTDITYNVAIAATDANSATNSYATTTLTVIQLGTSTSTPVCGNGTQETGETCDDSNTTTETCTYGQTSCSVCNASCQTVAGATSYCGDNTTDAANNETCDDGNAVTEACAYGQLNCIVCTATCQSGGGVTSYCGDGAVDAGNGEACDDSNITSGDGCSATCQREPSVSAGYDFTCAVKSDRTVKCWGANAFYGQLGDGTGVNSPTPVSVSGISTATMVAAGYYHACALLADGTVQCWGLNSNGQLGEGDDSPSVANAPVSVLGISNATMVAAGMSHTCVLLADGTVKCWGDNSFGQLGDGTNDSSFTPVSVSGISNATMVAAGMSHTCALLADGTVQCWGYNGNGQLGYGGGGDSNVPVTVTGISTATSISAGSGCANNTCAVLADGTVQCWGDNSFGKLGNGGGGNSNIPVTATGISTATAVSIGEIHACALLADQTMMCWGENGEGEFGNNTTSDSNVPVAAATGISTAINISVGYGQTCAVVADGTLYCWGYNDSGKVGDGSGSDQLLPVEITGF